MTGMDRADVCLVTMPYAHLMRPSIALGILKACLAREGVCAHVEYANLRFAERVGLEVNGLMMYLRTDSLIGEWTFAGAAFRDGRETLEDLLGAAGRVQPPNLPRVAVDDRQFAPVFRQLREYAPIFVDEVARAVVARRPGIVGCTSTFEQHCASLALLRRVKELAPEIVTMLGGANCETTMGRVTIRHCPWVDVVVSGEADGLIGPLCRQLLDKGLQPGARYPDGVMTQTGGEGRAVMLEMQSSPAPDFDDYFEALAGSPLRERITPALAVESSRGCWWGQKSHCTFCGLNGAGMNYRAKPATQVFEEWQQLQERYPVRKYTVVDNIIDRQHLRDLLPRLAEAGAPLALFYETKANLRREEVRAMAEAGVRKFQPGIEALHDDLLKLMAKGNSTLINVQLLKYAREFGLWTTWMLLVGFPGEDPAWHAEVAEWLPLLYHLQPPNGLVHIRYDRFSVYHEEAEKYGLNLQPFPAYRLVYPFPEADLSDFAYFFYDENRVEPHWVHPAIERLGTRVAEWVKAYHRPVRPLLCAWWKGDRLELLDTRPCAVARRHQLNVLASRIYACCDPAITGAGIARQLRLTEAEVAEELAPLVEARLMLEWKGRHLALACFGEVPALDPPEAHPSGSVALFDPKEFESLGQAREQLRKGSPRLTELLEGRDV